MERRKKRKEQKRSDDKPAAVNSSQTYLEVVKDELISAFVHELCESLKGLLSGQQDIVHQVERILPGLLEDYSSKLSHGVKWRLQKEKEAAAFVRFHCQYVSSTVRWQTCTIRHFFRVFCCTLFYLTISSTITSHFVLVLRETDDGPRQATSVSDLTTHEKISYWNTEGSDAPDLPVEKPKESMLIVKEKEAPDSHLLSEAWTILVESRAYQWLLGRLRIWAGSVLTTREGTTMEAIRHSILHSLNARNRANLDGTYEAHYVISWSPLEFLRKQSYQKGENQAIGEVITVTGSAVDAQAMTCAQYMNQMWPLSADETLGALQAAMTAPSKWHHCICSYPGFVASFEY